MRVRTLHLETGEPGDGAHRRPRERPLFEVEFDGDVVEMARKNPNKGTKGWERWGKLLSN